MRDFLLTLNCHPLDSELFESLMTYFLQEKIKDVHKVYNVEWDGSPQKHLHVVFEAHFNESEKARNHFNDKLFKNSIKNSNTTQTSLDVKMIRRGEECETIGYCFKEQHLNSRKSFGNKTPQYISTAIDLYWSKKRLNVKKDEIKSSKILITSKNIHAYYEYFVEKDELMNPYNYQVRMTGIHNCSFLNITQKQTALFAHELLLQSDFNNPNFQNNIQNYQNGGLDNYWELKHEVQEFLQKNFEKLIIEFEVPAIIRNWIKNDIFYQCPK